MSSHELITAKEAYTFREMIEAIPFVDNDRRRLEPVYDTLILFVSEPRQIKHDTFEPEKTIADLSREAEDKIKWILNKYQYKLENRLIFLIVRLEEQSWRCPKSKFRNNDIVRIKTLPTLMWLGDPFKLEGIEATSLMTIKEFIYQKQKEEEITPFIHEEVCSDDEKYYDVKKPVLIFEFKTSPQFILKFWDKKIAAKVANEAEKRVRQVKEGACEYDVMMDVFTRLCPDEKRKFLKELEEAEPEILPYNGAFDRGFIDKDYERLEVELELDNPNVKSDIIKVERYPTPKQQQEIKEAKLKAKKKKGKGMRKKGKGKGKKGKRKKGKGKGYGEKGKGKKGGKKKKK